MLVIVYKAKAMNAKCDDLFCMSVCPPACCMYRGKSYTLIKSGIVGLPYNVTVKLVIVYTDRASEKTENVARKVPRYENYNIPHLMLCFSLCFQMFSIYASV